MDFQLDSNHDLAIEGGNLVLISGVEAIAQDVDCRLRTFLGEWFLDTRIGVPYFEKILGQKPRLSVVQQILREAIMSAPGMTAINDYNIEYTGATRAVTVSFKGTCVEGTFAYNKELILVGGGTA